MFVVKNTIATKRIARAVQYPYLVGFGKTEYTILMKLLSDVPLTEFEEERADRMQTTLGRLSNVTVDMNTEMACDSNTGIVQDCSD